MRDPCSRGSWPGERRGGRKKGTRNRETIARIALLAANGFPTERRRGSERTPESLDRYYRRTYGITLADYQRLLVDQGGKCAICESVQAGHWTERWSVDHDHATGRVRALLCHACNMLVGQIERRRHLIAAVEAYLLRHSGRATDAA